MKRRKKSSSSSLMIAFSLVVSIAFSSQIVLEDTDRGAFGVPRVSAQVSGDPIPTPPSDPAPEPLPPTPPNPNPDPFPDPDPFCPFPDVPCPDNDEKDTGWLNYLVSYFGFG